MNQQDRKREEEIKYHFESPEESGESDDDEPQFKKARYAWQLKGMNYREEFEEHEQGPSNITAIGSRANRDNSYINHTVNNMEMNDEHEVLSNPSQASQAQDLQFLKWHERQMVRYCIENKLNSALETYLGDDQERQEILDLNIMDIVEEAESDLEVNDEGIMMAIESHGLRVNGWHRERYLGLDLNLFDDSSSSSDDDSVILLGSPQVVRINPNDFLDTAVSAAISEKGLSHPDN